MAELNSCQSPPESVWPTKPKIVTIWPFTEKVCQFLVSKHTYSDAEHGEEEQPEMCKLGNMLQGGYTYYKC